MLGDSLSDAHHALVEARDSHYADEFAALPSQLRRQVNEALATLELAREAVDRHQAVEARKALSKPVARKKPVTR